MPNVEGKEGCGTVAFLLYFGVAGKRTHASLRNIQIPWESFSTKSCKPWLCHSCIVRRFDALLCLWLRPLDDDETVQSPVLRVC